MSAATHARLVVRGGLVILSAVTLAAAFEVATYRAWRRWCLSWGATESEAARTTCRVTSCSLVQAW